MYFKTKMTLVISVLMVLGLSIFGFFSYQDTKKNAVIQIESSLVMASNSLTDYIDLWLYSKKSGVKNTAKSFKDVEVTATQDLIDRLKEATEVLGAMDSYIGLEDGSMILGSESKLPDAYDPRVRPWYTQAKETKQLGITDIYTDATTGKPIISIMAPIMEEKTFLGVFGIDIALDAITKTISNVNFNGGYGVLQDSKGLVVAHPNKELHGKDLSKILPELTSQFTDKEQGIINYTFNGAGKIYTFKI